MQVLYVIAPMITMVVITLASMQYGALRRGGQTDCRGGPRNGKAFAQNAEHLKVQHDKISWSSREFRNPAHLSFRAPPSQSPHPHLSMYSRSLLQKVRALLDPGFVHSLTRVRLELLPRDVGAHIFVRTACVLAWI